MNRIDNLFHTKKKNILSVYFTAGYPKLNSVEEIILLLEKHGADMIEIGIPYSDPLADGPVIQETSKIAIANGMTLKNLFLQLHSIRKKTSIPLLLMGYMNPVMQYGFGRFCKSASDAGIDGLIIPDLPMKEYESDYKTTVTENNLKNIFLITPDTSEERIRQIDSLSSGFVYLVSSASTTGKTGSFTEVQLSYFKRIADMRLKSPAVAGFGIHNSETKEQVFKYVNGAIVGSAYLRALQSSDSMESATADFFDLLNSH
jgi:tryptophan synthase alpha chain